MKRLSLLAVLTFAPLALAESSGAEASPEAQAAATLVQKELLAPMAARERDQSKFSRARLPPQERRVRILDEKPRSDGHGAAFVSFAVDARHGVEALGAADQWRLGAVTGCVYVGRGEIFVKVGDRHRPAAFLLGKNLKPVAEDICVAAPPVT